MNNTEFTHDDIKKYSNYMITSSKNISPGYEWSEGIFQRFKPISGDFPIGDNFEGNLTCVNNQTGRGYYANPCGYWNSKTPQFNPGKIHDGNKMGGNGNKMDGSLFPIGNTNSFNVMSTPNNRVVYGYTRIGEEYKNS